MRHFDANWQYFDVPLIFFLETIPVAEHAHIMIVNTNSRHVFSADHFCQKLRHHASLASLRWHNAAVGGKWAELRVGN